ncbi:MAG: hypothetical protein LBB54_05770 [Cellulomonadaceae bacterium]|jgi:hypothetical protein|nr:hypothetical protein [Cellulomonadaceae bacterium]
MVGFWVWATAVVVLLVAVFVIARILNRIADPIAHELPPRTRLGQEINARVTDDVRAKLTLIDGGLDDGHNGIVTLDDFFAAPGSDQRAA